MCLPVLYRLATDLGNPLIQLYLRRRLNKGREDKLRFAERLGQASIPRPPGFLVWCHAASVGEAMSLLALIKRLKQDYPAVAILVTTGTVTSAQLLAHRLPDGAFHHYIPVDRHAYVTQFLNHWHPNLAIWVESELWPTMLAAIRQRAIPAVLLNARMSDKSYRQWQWVSGWARRLLGAFRLCLTQTDAEVAIFQKLGAQNVSCLGNLKYAADPLPDDAAARADLATQIGARPVWLAASTHAGEEEWIIAAHQKLIAPYPNLLTVIAPRHAVRGDVVAALLRKSDIRYARRSTGQAITADTELYLADTMGELGVFYRLSPITVMGGSLMPVGGHNPIEPAQLHSALLLGPHMHHFRVVSADFIAHQAAQVFATVDDLTECLTTWLAHPEKAQATADHAYDFVQQQGQVLDQVMGKLSAFLPSFDGREAA